MGITTHWLRWWDKAGNLLLWSAEQTELERQRAEAEKQRAEAAIAELAEAQRRSEALTAKLRELGFDPDQVT